MATTLDDQLVAASYAEKEAEQAPAFLSAGNAHTNLNNANPDISLFDSAVDLVTKGIPLSLASGANQVYNILPTVGNWMGGNYEQSDFNQMVKEYDDDLSKYYKEHELGVDAVGFMLGSLVPGMAGVKVLNAGQKVLGTAMSTGKFGKGVADAFGMLPESRGTYIKGAIKSITESGNAFKLTETNTLKALGMGFGQNALEGAAFTTLVNATMYNSPVLEARDTKDLVWDVATGAALGGVIGGVFAGVGTAYKIKKAGKLADEQIAQWGITREPTPNMSTAERIMDRAEMLDEMPPIPTGDLAERATRAANATRDKVHLEIRSDFNKLTGNDDVMSQALFDQLRNSPPGTARDNYTGVLGAARVGHRSSTEVELGQINAILKKNGMDYTKLTPEQFELYNNTRVNYVKLRGEGMGNVADERPSVLNLADKMSKGETMTLHPQGLMVGKKLYKNTNNPNMPFNILGVDHLQVEARYQWSEMLPKWLEGPGHDVPVIHANDLPLLQKVVKDGLTKVKVIPEGTPVSGAIEFAGHADIEAFLKHQKGAISNRLASAHTIPASVDTFMDKIKGLFGININIVDDATVNGFFFRMAGTATMKSGVQHAVSGDVISISKNSALHRTMAQNVATLKHEEGHAIFQSLLDSYGTNAANLRTALPELRKEVERISRQQRPHLWQKSVTDPKTKAYRGSDHEMFADAFSWLSVNHDKLKNYPEFNSFAGHLVRPVPQEVIDAVARRAAKPTAAEIAKIVDIEESALSGTIRPGGWYARDLARTEYTAMLDKAGVRASERIKDVHQLPTYSKVVSTSEKVKDINGNEVNAYVDLKMKAKIYEDSARQAAAHILGEDLAGISDKALLGGGAVGPTFLASEGGVYGSRGSWGAYVGQRAHDLINKAKTATSDLFTPTLHKLAADTDAAIEFSVLNERARNARSGYQLAPDGKSLIMAGDPSDIIPINSPLVQKLVADHITKNGDRLGKLGMIKANEGLPNHRDPTVYYPLPRNIKDTPFYAFVIDDSITGTGHSKMLYAKDAETLEGLKAGVTNQNIPGLRVLTKTESEDYFKAHGKYEYERSLNENYINNEMARRGVSSGYLPITDPKKIVTDFMDWHLGRDSALVREAISHRFSRQMETLRASAAPAMNASKSKFGYISPQAYAENSVNDPASNLMKLMLDIQKTDEYPFWKNMSSWLDTGFSKVREEVAETWQKATHPDQLRDINNALAKVGYGGPQVDEGLFRAMNGTIPKGDLTAFVAKSNGLLSTIALRLDPLNALNNFVGHTVLYGTEGIAITKAIKKANPEAAGELAALGNIKLPGTDDYIFSPTKILAKSFARRNDKNLRQWYEDHGFITTIGKQYDQTLDALAMRAGDTAGSLDAKVAKAFEIARGVGEKGELLTGNKMAEEFNRFLSADFMKQITDIAVKHGIMDEKAALTYINTFVNRVEGNFLASQRPVLFQGPVGQAIGLFQTYNFNLIQQLLRHVGEGNGKHAATMMGLQGLVYGANGLPGFNAMNTYIVGSAGGNVNHADLYQTIFSGAGKEAGEWITYGALSNAFSLFHPDLKMNMYSRGDINPRSFTIVPTDPAKVPIFQATAKFITNMKDGISQIGMGADIWSTFLRGLEHNGISRPLAGMAQVLGAVTNESGQVIATSNQGNLLMAHDLASLSSGVRFLGGKPMDESIVQDQMFRINAYRAHDADKRKSLSEAIKTSILGGGEPDAAAIEGFAETYAKSGGKQSEFTQFMVRQYKNTSVTQAAQLRDKLGSPYSKQVQLIMGGEGE